LALLDDVVVAPFDALVADGQLGAIPLRRVYEFDLVAARVADEASTFDVISNRSGFLS
jgi:hypothetical protein